MLGTNESIEEGDYELFHLDLTPCSDVWSFEVDPVCHEAELLRYF